MNEKSTAVCYTSIPYELEDRIARIEQATNLLRCFLEFSMENYFDLGDNPSKEQLTTLWFFAKAFRIHETQIICSLDLLEKEQENLWQIVETALAATRAQKEAG